MKFIIRKDKIEDYDPQKLIYSLGRVLNSNNHILISNEFFIDKIYIVKYVLSRLFEDEIVCIGFDVPDEFIEKLFQLRNFRFICKNFCTIQSYDEILYIKGLLQNEWIKNNVIRLEDSDICNVKVELLICTNELTINNCSIRSIVSEHDVKIINSVVENIMASNVIVEYTDVDIEIKEDDEYEYENKYLCYRKIDVDSLKFINTDNRDSNEVDCYYLENMIVRNRLEQNLHINTDLKCKIMIHDGNNFSIKSPSVIFHSTNCKKLILDSDEILLTDCNCTVDKIISGSIRINNSYVTLNLEYETGNNIEMVNSYVNINSKCSEMSIVSNKSRLIIDHMDKIMLEIINLELFNTIVQFPSLHTEFSRIKIINCTIRDNIIDITNMNTIIDFDIRHNCLQKIIDNNCTNKYNQITGRLFPISNIVGNNFSNKEIVEHFELVNLNDVIKYSHCTQIFNSKICWNVEYNDAPIINNNNQVSMIIFDRIDLIQTRNDNFNIIDMDLLETISIYGSKIKRLSINNTSLSEIRIRDSLIENLIINNSNLSVFDSNNSDIYSLMINMSKLVKFSFDSNNTTKIDLSNNFLEDISINCSSLKTIDLSKNNLKVNKIHIYAPLLSYIDLSYNRMIELELENILDDILCDGTEDETNFITIILSQKYTNSTKQYNIKKDHITLNNKL